VSAAKGGPRLVDTTNEADAVKVDNDSDPAPEPATEPSVFGVPTLIFRYSVEDFSEAIGDENVASEHNEDRVKVLYVKDEIIHDAIIFSLEETRHDRTVALFEAVMIRCLKEKLLCTDAERPTKPAVFVYEFFRKLAPEKDSASLKRFLTLHGEEFARTHPGIFSVFCQELVTYLQLRMGEPDSADLLRALIGQPSILTSSAFVRGFLTPNSRLNAFIEYGWREAIEEGLRPEYEEGGKSLWAELTRSSAQLCKTYPPWGGLRALVLSKLPTKQSREEAWAAENAPSFRRRLLLQLNVDLDFIPSVLLGIISEYAIVTWLNVPPATPESFLVLQNTNRGGQFGILRLTHNWC